MLWVNYTTLEEKLRAEYLHFIHPPGANLNNSEALRVRRPPGTRYFNYTTTHRSTNLK